MILPEVLVSQSRVLAEHEAVEEEGVWILAEGQPLVSANLPATMVVTFAVVLTIMLVIVGSTINEAIVVGAVAAGAAIFRLARRPPYQARDAR